MLYRNQAQYLCRAVLLGMCLILPISVFANKCVKGTGYVSVTNNSSNTIKVRLAANTVGSGSPITGISNAKQSVGPRGTITYNLRNACVQNCTSAAGGCVVFVYPVSGGTYVNKSPNFYGSGAKFTWTDPGTGDFGSYWYKN